MVTDSSPEHAHIPAALALELVGGTDKSSSVTAPHRSLPKLVIPSQAPELRAAAEVILTSPMTSWSRQGLEPLLCRLAKHPPGGPGG
jgi:hypothetical protein